MEEAEGFWERAERVTEERKFRQNYIKITRTNLCTNVVHEQN